MHRFGGVDPHADFNIYAIEWSPDRIDWFFNETRYHTVTLSDLPPEAADSFRQPHYLLLNLALGGTWGRRIDDAILPQRYVVDYVRVYEQAQP